MNNVVLSGRLTRDPEVREGSSTSVVHATIAVDSYNSATKSREGEFFPLVVFGQQGEFLSKYGAKGRELTIIGRLHNNQWNDKATGEKRSRTEVIVDRLVLHGKGDAKKAEDDQILF